MEIVHNGTGSQSGFEHEGGNLPTPGYPGASGDTPTSPSRSARNPSIRSDQEEERPISFWGALKIPVNRHFYALCAR